MDNRSPRASNGSYRSGAIEIDAMHRSVLIEGTPAKIGTRAFDVLLRSSSGAGGWCPSAS